MKTIKIAVEGKTTLPYSELTAFQGDLKALAKEQYERLRNNILKLGFSFVFHVWQSGGKNYIIDGHQRYFVLGQMQKVEGYELPEFPVAIVQAKTFKQAKLKVLAGASQFGRMSEKGLAEFMEANDISFDILSMNFDFPEIDFPSFNERFLGEQSEETLPPAQGLPDMASSSDQVKQVQLLFSAKAHEEFMKHAQDLAKVYKTENVTDTVTEALRAEHKARLSKSK